MPTRRLQAVARFASIITLALASAAVFVVARAHAGALPPLPKSSKFRCGFYMCQNGNVFPTCTQKGAWISYRTNPCGFESR